MTLKPPVSAWRLTYRGFAPEEEMLREALCATGNGAFVTRGAAPEADADEVHYPGTYIAGGYDRLTTVIAGREVENEDLVNAPNWLPLTFRHAGEDEWFHLSRVRIKRYRLDLDMRTGVLTRFVTFVDAAGRRTELTQRRLVHMRRRNVAALETTLVAKNWSGPIVVRSALDGTVANSGVARYRELDGRHLEPVYGKLGADDTICLVVETRQSRLRIAESARTRLFVDGEQLIAHAELEERPGYIAQHLSAEIQQDVPLSIEKTATVFTSRERGISEPGYAACTTLERTPGFAELLATHIMAWDFLWRRCAIALNGETDANRTLHLHVFHILQTVSHNSVDLDAGVPARGLHGEAYRGHVFWDELFIFPYLNCSFPDLTRALLLYRFRRLTEARWRARQAGFQGALFPWQSGSDGREETQVLHLNPNSGRWLPDHSHLQRHVNAAIGYNIWQYYQFTLDMEFLSAYGAEMFLEIARLFASMSSYDPALDRYQIRGVVGPDEYHDGYPWADEPGLDNNTYTNVMAVWILRRALDILDLLPQPRRDELVATLGLTTADFELWELITRKMRVVFHDGVLSQFEHYDRLEEFDWDAYRARYGDIHRLDRILEHEGDTPNRYRVSKQADVLMLFYLFSQEELRRLMTRMGYPFDEQLVTDTIHYYAQRTSHGSTLSRIVQSWVMARADRAESWYFFYGALQSDLLDIQGGTTKEGIHLGAMAGTVDMVVRGYVGLEIRDDILWFDPSLPLELDKLRYALLFRGHWIDVEAIGDRFSISTRRSAAGPITVALHGETVTLEPGAKLVGTLDRGGQGGPQTVAEGEVHVVGPLSSEPPPTPPCCAS